MCDLDTNTDGAAHDEPELETESRPESYPDVEGDTLMTLITPGENSKTPPAKVVSGWTPSEKRQLRTFLRTRGHLSWSRIAQEYEETFHKGRSASSISGQARYLGLSVGRPPRNKPVRQTRRDPLVLKVRFPSQSSERTGTTESVEYPTGALLDDEISRESCQHDDELHGQPTSPCPSPGLPFDVQFSTDEDSATVRQGNHDLPGPFDLILN